MGELTVQASLTRGLRLFSSQTAGPCVTDIQPAVRDNGNLIGAVRGVPVSQDGPQSRPKPIFSAL